MVLFSFTNVNVNGGILGWKAKGMDERERERDVHYVLLVTTQEQGPSLW